MSKAWMVIYPKGDKNYLDIAEVIDYQKNDWCLASYAEFEHEHNAALYAQKLSKKCDIPLVENSFSPFLHILDLEDVI